MAAQWLRWNPTSHIFEYSTDNGASFNPLPLNAAIITEGTLPPAVIPGGSGPSLSAPNTWTGLNTYSGINPGIRFNETDAAADQKNWDISADTSAFKIKTLNDLLASPATLFSLDRAGNLTLAATGGIASIITSSFDGASQLTLANLSAGANAYVAIVFQNNVGATRGYIGVGSGASTNPYIIADALSLYAGAPNGLNLTTFSGPIYLKTSNTARITISGAGAITIAGATTFSAPVTMNSTLNVVGALTAASFSPSTINTGDITCGNITCAQINTQGNMVTCGAVTAGYANIGGVNATGVQSVTLSAANSAVALNANTSMLRVTGGGFSIQSITGGSTGRILFIMCVSGGMTLATGGNISLATGTIGNGSGVIVIFDGTYWRVCS
jgi:hypothetical protein